MDSKLRQLIAQRENLYEQFKDIERQINAIENVQQVRRIIESGQIKKSELLNAIQDLPDDNPED